ncbi:MAG: Major facilitator superfamily, partial [Candidatus Azambacteria bacterium GW2011_GWB2_46_37]
IIFLVSSTIFTLGRSSEAFLLLRAKDAGVALALLPIIYFVYNITFALFSTPAGILSDKIGRRNTFMVGMLIFSMTYFLFARLHSVSAIWILFAVYGFYSAFTEGIGRAIVADLVEEKLRATAFGIYNAFNGIALLPASLIFGFLWDKFGVATAFNWGAGLALAAFFVFLFLRFRYRPHYKVV